MPRYNIGGNWYTTDQELSDEQIDEIAAQESSTSSAGKYVSEGLPWFAEQAANVVSGALAGAGEGIAKVGSYALSPDDYDKKEIEKAFSGKARELGLTPEGGPYQFGQLGGEMGLGAGAINLAGRGLATLGLPAMGAAISRGGLGPLSDYGFGGMPTAIRIPGQLAGKAAAGATAGAIAGSVVDPEAIGSSAKFGAAVPVIAPFLARLTGVAGPEARQLPIAPWLDKAMDYIAGRSPAVRAGEIMRGAASPQTRAALRANPNVPAGEAAAGVYDPTFQALAKQAESLTPEASRRTGEAAMRTNLAEQAELAQLSGGRTQEGSRSFLKTAKEDLQARTEADRRDALHAVNDNTRKLTYWEREEADAAKQAQELSGRLSEVDIYGNNIVSRPSQMEQALLQQQVRESRALARQLQLDAAGVKKLEIGNVTGYLDQTANTPGPRADELQSGLLTELSSRLKRLADLNGGYIDAEDLYQIRKTGINDVVDSLLGGRNQSGNQQRAASLVSVAKKHIDDAIERAGGATWRKYLNDYMKGAHELDQHQMAAYLQKMYNENPAEFVAIVRGERADLVEKQFGFGRVNFREEMTPHPEYGGQNMFGTFNNIARRLERDLAVSPKESGRMMSRESQAAAGAKALDELISQNRGAMEVLRGLVAGKAGLGGANELIKAMGNVDPQARRIISEAMRTSRTAEEAMRKMPFDLTQRVVNAAGQVGRIYGYGEGSQSVGRQTE